MKISFAGTELTDWSDTFAQGVAVSGQRAFEAVAAIGAASMKFYDRKIDALTIEFTVSKFFSALKDAQQYLLNHFRGLTKTGTCEIECGAPGGQLVEFNDAVLIPNPIGLIAYM